MYRPNTVIMLLLLALMAGNLALVGVNKDVLDDVEAVAEWRIDGDLLDSDLSDEPDMPAALALFREAAVFVTGPDVEPYRQRHAAATSKVKPATRAPPFVASV